MARMDPIYGRNTFVDLDGELCVRHESALTDRPVILSLWWPTGQRTAGVVNCYGREILNQPLRAGRFSEDGYTFESPNMPRCTIHLKDRGRTIAIKSSERAATPPPPKVLRGKPLRWRNSQWERDLKAGPQALGLFEEEVR